LKWEYGLPSETEWVQSKEAQLSFSKTYVELVSRPHFISFPFTFTLFSLHAVSQQTVANAAAEPSKAFLHNQTGTTQLLDLIKRTDEDPLRWEGTRVLAAAIRSLKGSFVPSDRIVEVLVDMLRTGQKHPALINEAVVALILSIQALGQLPDPQ
jgi:hypothetical protein